MKATDVYREARAVLTPWCKKHGFKRTRGATLGWTKCVGEAHLFFWLQVSQDGWDPHAGSKFVVEFQRSCGPRMFDASHETLRYRLPHFLTEDELGRVRSMQNNIIQRLTRPPRDYFVYQMNADIVSWYVKKFDQVEASYRKEDDIWFRYHEPTDVRCWAEFVLAVIPRVIHELGKRPRPTGARS